MKRILLFCSVYLPSVIFSQVAITFSDEFNLEEQAQYDNWVYQENKFFVLPLSINDFIAVENYQFNIIYNPQIVQLAHLNIDDINQQDFTDSYSVLSTISGQQGSISAEVFDISSNQAMATITYSHTSPISEDQFDNGYAVLIYLPFKKSFKLEIKKQISTPKLFILSEWMTGNFIDENLQTLATILNK